ncbi:hypothetical protein JTE90_010501 [Oedothorax gibbosus]|uniref:Uncharacterized protein n=1 Tax=Oedothorax gibbosus TaxID=931172 RepID=A0AAV6W4C2_9ARAC|nr:hypothetical protein JTE90_010501 [Oedothorax gibbosus]
MALGTYCKALGIDEEVLSGQKTKICEEKSVTNGVMWELKKYKMAKKISTKELIDQLIAIFQMKCENTEAIQLELDKKYENLSSIRGTITKAPHKYRGELERLMNYSFDFPAEMGMDPVTPFEPTVCANLGPKLLKVLKEKGGDEDDVDMSGDDDDEQAKKRKAREEIIQLKKDLGTAKKIILSLNDKMSDLNKRCQILNDLSKSGVSERRRIESDISKLRIEWSNVMITWHDCMERLNHVNNNKGNYLDVGYMVRRNKTKQGIFDELSFEFEKTLEDFKHKISSLIDKEKRKKKVVSREYRQKGKSDRKRAHPDSEETEENKKPCLSEEANKLPASTSLTVEEFMKSEKVDEFKGGKFVNALKAIYIELTSMTIPCNNVHEVLYSILDVLEALNTDKLPSPSFAGNIYMEARMAASLQAFSDCLKMNKVSICNDGITKFEFQDGSYNVTLNEDTTLKLGVRDASNGNPDTSLSVLKDLLGDILSAKLDGNQAAETLVKTIKLCMSEGSILDKKVLEILFMYKQKMSPIVANDLASLPDLFRSRAILLNNYCTGIYFLLGLAKLADFTVYAWESASFGNIKEVESEKCIRSKLVKQMHLFSSAVDALNEPHTKKSAKSGNFFIQKLNSSPLAPHKGNLFNLVFHNSAGIWFYHEVGLLNEFLTKQKEKDPENNHPLADLLNEEHSFAFAKALGLLGKLLIVPLWTVLEDEEVEIGLRYNSLLQKATEWSKDASKFMKGQERLFEDVPVSHDAVYVSLIKDNEASDSLTKKFLELMFTAFARYITFFLGVPELNGDPAMDVDGDKKLSVHEDFAIFDKITLCIHSLKQFAEQALKAYSTENKEEWEEKLKSLQLVEEDSSEVVKILYKRKIKLGEIQNKNQSPENDNFHLIEKRYKLIDDLIKWGGLWKNEKEIDARIKDMKETDRLTALRAQIRFRRHVLGEEHDNGLLDLASDGGCYDANKLIENLKIILKKECGLNEISIFEFASATDDNQKKKELTELCANAQELKPASESEKNIVSKENFYWLLGKLVHHRCVFDAGKETATGVCIARKSQCGTSSYFIRYEGKGVFVVPDTRVALDLKSGSLMVTEPSPHDIVGRRLSRAFIKDDGDFEWHDGKVVGIIDRKNFVVEFDCYGSKAQVDEGANIPDLMSFTFTTNLLADYRTEHLRLL